MSIALDNKIVFMKTSSWKALPVTEVKEKKIVRFEAAT